MPTLNKSHPTATGATQSKPSYGDAYVSVYLSSRVNVLVGNSKICSDYILEEIANILLHLRLIRITLPMFVMFWLITRSLRPNLTYPAFAHFLPCCSVYC